MEFYAGTYAKSVSNAWSFERLYQSFSRYTLFIFSDHFSLPD
jgi:hypothetical protein